MNRFELVLATISLWMARVGGAALLGVAILTTVEVGMRAARLQAPSIATELASYALAVGATWALAYVVFERSHVRVDVLAQRLPAPARGVLDALALASLAVVGAMLSFGAFGMVSTSLRLASKSNTTLGMPLAWPQGAWLFGLLWFTFIALYRTAQAVVALVHRDFSEVSRIGSSPSADDEIEDAISETEGRIVAVESGR